MFSQKGIQRHPVKEWNEREVYRWLKQKGLSKLWRHFRGMHVLLNLNRSPRRHT